MEVVVLIAFDAGAAATNAALLQRIGALAIKGHARLSLMGVDPGTDEQSPQDVVAVGLPTRGFAEKLLGEWRSERVIPSGTPARILRLRSVWSPEPLAFMFP